MFTRSRSKTGKAAQMELPIRRKREADRNFSVGGRSFYFFDFDDNVAILSTPIYVFHKDTGAQVRLSSRDFAEVQRHLGKPGPYQDYKMDFCEKTGSFRNFRDKEMSVLERVVGKPQSFIQDLNEALGFPDYHWKGPSWSCFYHAVFNDRPISVITARGHHPDTIKKGIKQFVKHSHLPKEPNYLSVYPVNHSGVKEELGAPVSEVDVAKLKQSAIRSSVERAIEIYGDNPYHRFGMSDDDPKNVDLIIQEMTQLKREFSEMSFFVISTHRGNFIKREVFTDHTQDLVLSEAEQLQLF